MPFPLTRDLQPGFRNCWKKREAAVEAVLVRAAQKAAKQLVDQGVGYIGEISTLGITRAIVQSLNLSGVWFQEFIGSDLPNTNIEKKESLSFPWLAMPLIQPILYCYRQARKRQLPGTCHFPSTWPSQMRNQNLYPAKRDNGETF